MQNSDIVDGVDYIFRESEKQGRPCVVNLSLGDGIGGHDGTNFMDIMLDRMVGPGKIITVAMGNSRDMPVYTELMSPSDTLRTFVGRSNTDISYGLVDIWADEPGEPFSVCLDLYDSESDEILNTTGFFALDTMPKSSVFTSESVDGTLVYEARMESELYVFNGRYRLLFSSIIRKAPKMKRYSYFMWRQITRRSGLGATMARAYLRTWERGIPIRSEREILLSALRHRPKM